MAAQVTPTTNTGTGTWTGLTAGASIFLNPGGGYFGADAQDYRLIVRVTANQTFRLSILTTDGTTTAVVKQVASAVVSVDGGATGYVNNAELDCPLGSNMAVQVWSVGGTSAGIYDYRMYQAGGG